VNDRLLRAGAALHLLLTGAPRRNRQRFHGGATGLRLVAGHETRGPSHMRRLRQLVEHCERHFVIATPDDVVALTEGRYEPPERDAVVFTFDDGFSDNFEAAQFLAERKIRAIFFVIPSFLGRTPDEYYEFHARNGVDAFRFLPHQRWSRGLERSQTLEMLSMGHWIAAHNYAHRNLGELHRESDLAYEIQRSVDELSELLGTRCEDFAWGFGRSQHFSAEAARYAMRTCRRVYSCVRGLNVPGRTPRLLLRDAVQFEDSFLFSRLVLAGGMDDRYVKERETLERWAGRLPAPGASS
jgi:peptidoglycan/xylan/chitin deacetylase (PgdA/CDA1 family)